MNDCRAVTRRVILLPNVTEYIIIKEICLFVDIIQASLSNSDLEQNAFITLVHNTKSLQACTSNFVHQLNSNRSTNRNTQTGLILPLINTLFTIEYIRPIELLVCLHNNCLVFGQSNQEKWKIIFVASRDPGGLRRDCLQ